MKQEEQFEQQITTKRWKVGLKSEETRHDRIHMLAAYDTKPFKISVRLGLGSVSPRHVVSAPALTPPGFPFNTPSDPKDVMIQSFHNSDHPEPSDGKRLSELLPLTM